MRARALIAVALVATTAAVYVQVRDHEFVDLDDFVYFTGNPNLQGDFSFQRVGDAFTRPYHANWTPLTSLSLHFDRAVFGLEPPGTLLANVALHAASSVILFLAFAQLTGATWRSAFVAAVFALHPLHVESVAWASQRKDVLAGLFWMLTLLAYAREDSRSRTLCVTACVLLGLLSKPTLVTLPFALLLLDYWPRGRLTAAGSAAPDPARLGRAIAEKLPLFALVAAVSAVTLAVQGEGGGTLALPLSLETRVGNALISYAALLGKSLWPTGLAAFYPHPLRPAPVSQVMAAGALLLAVTGASIALARRRPYFLVGWLWYLGTLVPMIGLVQVGMQSRADRYTYLSQIGLSVIVAWGAHDLAGASRRGRVLVAAAGSAACVALAGLSWLQVGTWKNTLSLFEHAIAVTHDNYFAHHRLGVALRQLSRTDEAIAHYEATIRIQPGWAAPHLELGNMREERGESKAAIRHYGDGLALAPEHGRAHKLLGLLLVREERYEEARHPLGRAAALGEEPVRAHLALAYVAVQLDRPDDAIRHNREALRLDASQLSAANNLAWLLATREPPELREPDEAIRIAEDAVRRAGAPPSSLLDTLAVSYAAAGRFEEASEAATRAVERATSEGDAARAEEIRQRRDLFRRGRAYAPAGRPE